MIIITVFLAFSVVSMTATKWIYDGIFARVENQTTIPAALVPLKESGEPKQFYSGEHRLTGYLYRSDAVLGDAVSADTLVVLSPGFRASADDYLWQIQSLLDYGWSVFAFDTTGSGNSEGDSEIGFAQALCDLDAALRYVEQNDRFGYREVALLGHSRGGYAACCALAYDYDIAAVVSISGLNSAMEGVMSAAVDKVGVIAYGNYGFLWLYQAMLFGADTLNQSAVEALSQSDVPTLVIHGERDEQVPLDRYSIVAHREAITSDAVEYRIWTEAEQDGHTTLLFDEDGAANRELMAAIHAFLIKSIV